MAPGNPKLVMDSSTVTQRYAMRAKRRDHPTPDMLNLESVVSDSMSYTPIHSRKTVWAESAGDGRVRRVIKEVGELTNAALHIAETRRIKLLNEFRVVDRFLIESLSRGNRLEYCLGAEDHWETLRTYLGRSAQIENLQLWQELGGFTGLLHQIELQNITDRALTETIPWIMVHFSPSASLYRAMSAGDFRLFSAVQSFPDLTQAINDVRRSWRATDLIHADLKWDNILVHKLPSSPANRQVKIIDWEFAGYGDPSWDIGTVFSEFLLTWSLSVPIVPDEDAPTLVQFASVSLSTLRPAIQHFWNSYAEAMEFDRETARERLIKSVRFAGARLIQTAFERTQTMIQLTPHIYLLLQLSLNIMERPDEAASNLFGIQHANWHSVQ